MQISVKIAAEGIQKPNRRAFLLLVRLKMAFPHGWANRTPAELGAIVGLSESTVRRRLYKLEQLGFITRHPSGAYVMRNLNPRKRAWTPREKALIRFGLMKPKLSTVKLKPEMCDEEIIAHLSSKVGGKYCRECDFMYKVKKDNELMRKGRSIQSFKSEELVHRLMRKYRPVNESPNRKIVISDRKMAARLGVTVTDFRKNIKPFWRVYGTLSWTSTLVQLKISRQGIKYGELPSGAFVHKANAYTHTTQYINIPKL